MLHVEKVGASQDEAKGVNAAALHHLAHAVHGSAVPGDSQGDVEQLWDFRRVAQYLGVSTRLAAEMRAAGRLPAAVVLGPRALRWVPAEVRAAVASLPRSKSFGEPTQLVAGKAAAGIRRVRCK